MNIFIDNRSGTPIYEQVYTRLKELIIGGEIAEDSPLPSIRALAKDLRISVITTKRAYEELESEGLIYTVPAKGSFAAPLNKARLREDALRKIEEHLSEIALLSERGGISESELRDMLLSALEEAGKSE